MTAAAVPDDGALIPARRQNTAPLSAHWAGRDYRACASTPPKYRAANSAGGRQCDECAWMQHETRGGFGPRMRVQFARSVPAKPDSRELLLCGRHAEAWRERDRGDGADPEAPKTKPAKRARR